MIRTQAYTRMSKRTRSTSSTISPVRYMDDRMHKVSLPKTIHGYEDNGLQSHGLETNIPGTYLPIDYASRLDSEHAGHE
jgi:hypothetical protein